jgi:tetratricopeptide (TPR) repeat protein/DNA-binding CsgD family transcriptional regulator
MFNDMKIQKKRFHFILGFIFLTSHFSCLAQTYLIDSLKKELNNKRDTLQLKILGDISFYISDYDPLESKRFATIELELANSLNNVRYKIDALNNIAFYYSTINNIDSAIFLQKQILKIANTNKWENSKASAYNNLGTYYWQTDDLDTAMNYYVLALKMYEQLDKKDGIAKTTNNIAGILTYQKQYDLALPNYKKALSINLIIKDSLELNNNLLNIGITFEQMQSYDSALFYYNRALIICNKVGDRLTKSIVLGSLGNVSHNIGKYKEALPYFQESIEINKLLGANDRLVESQISLGRTYILLHELDKAEKILLESLQKAKEINSKSYTRRAYSALSDLYEAKTDYKKALQFKNLYSTINDSLFNQESFQKVMDLNIKYESEKKAQQIALHQKEIEVLNQTAKVDQLRKSLLGGGLLASILIGGFAFYGIRQKLTKQQLLQAKEKEDYEKDLAFKKKELAIHTLHLVQKSELLETIHEKLEELKQEPEANKTAIRRLVQLIKNDYQTEKDWENFKSYFEQVHEHFDAKLREHFNDLTHNEIRLATLLKMNLSTKEIASILNISPDSVNKARYRLRKKLNLSTEDSLENFLLAL